MMRGISEVGAVMRWLRPQATGIVVSGVSLGSPVAAHVAHLEPVGAVALYTPILGLNAMIARHIHRQGASAHRAGTLMRSTVSGSTTEVIAVNVSQCMPSPSGSSAACAKRWR